MIHHLNVIPHYMKFSRISRFKEKIAPDIKVRTICVAKNKLTYIMLLLTFSPAGACLLSFLSNCTFDNVRLLDSRTCLSNTAKASDASGIRTEGLERVSDAGGIRIKGLERV